MNPELRKVIEELMVERFWSVVDKPMIYRLNPYWSSVADYLKKIKELQNKIRSEYPDEYKEYIQEREKDRFTTWTFQQATEINLKTLQKALWELEMMTKD